MQKLIAAIIMASASVLVFAQAVGLPPPVPVTGAYFGAWANPSGTANTTPGGVELAAETLESQIGRGLALHMHYFGWHASSGTTTPSFPDASMYMDYAHGRIPVVTWACGGTNEIANVLSGTDDALIDATAAGIKQFPGPIFLRWYWEMNLNPGANGQQCMETSGPDAGATGYIAAWQYIHDRITITDAVTNVAWLWNPSGQTPSSSFYPGDAYVDWIGFDGYDKIQANDFGPVFATFYNSFESHQKPFLIGETGECQGENAVYGAQATYLPLAEKEIEGKPNAGDYIFPLVKGFMYFDAAGQYGTTHPNCPSWVFDNAGLAAFAAMGADPYFGAGTDVIFRDGFEAMP